MKRFIRHFFVTALAVLTIPIMLQSQVRLPDDNPIPEQPKQFKPQEAIKADTMPKAVQMMSDSLPGGSRLDHYPYSSLQDSIYFFNLRLKIPPSVRFAVHASIAMSNLEIVRQKMQESPWRIAMRNMQVSDEAYRPDAREQVNHQVTISNAMAASLYRPNTTGGLSANFQQIGSFLGLTEDVSPRLKYEVKQTAQVSVVVYSTAATIVATILKKVQQPGIYQATWNLKDDKQRDMPDGDYVMEARVGENTFYRKRVVIGSSE